LPLNVPVGRIELCGLIDEHGLRHGRDRDVVAPAQRDLDLLHRSVYQDGQAAGRGGANLSRGRFVARRIVGGAGPPGLGIGAFISAE
jgi:hypothetical protein